MERAGYEPCSKKVNLIVLMNSNIKFDQQLSGQFKFGKPIGIVPDQRISKPALEVTLQNTP